jgi:poly(A) polymerase
VRPPGIDPTGPEQKAQWNLYKYGEEAYRHDVLVEWARSGAEPDDPGWRSRFTLPERWQAPKFPIGGAEVLALGVPEGPTVGMILSGLEGWWMGNDFVPDETELHAKLRELVAALERDQP